MKKTNEARECHCETDKNKVIRVSLSVCVFDVANSTEEISFFIILIIILRSVFGQAAVSFQ